MRVISGKYKGKKLQGFNIEGTRPTMDRVKESLFAMIQTEIPETKCLDLFAGSGSLGIEAISMGAKSCYFIDNNIEAIKVLKENTKMIEEDINIIHSDYKKFLHETKEKFDIIFLDPPYNNKMLNKALKCIEECQVLDKNGIIICEYVNEVPEANIPVIKEKNYGFKKIKILKL